ncbi:MAG TPA: hypothetical protein ENJ30_12605 [Desulfobulbaceae bacterium]|nr:hypothetical protein [Desulfobulbaceae bacterium]
MIKRYTIEIVPDQDPENPRDGETNAAQIYIPEWSKYRHFADKGALENLLVEVVPSAQFQALSDEEKELVEEGTSALFRVAGEARAALALPLYLMDHGGIALSTGDFVDSWDSGQVGWVFVTSKRMKEVLVKEEFNKEGRKAASEAIRQEIATFNAYLCGDVWGWVLKSHIYSMESQEWILYDDCEESVWGYYDKEQAEKEAEEAMKSAMSREKQESVFKLKEAEEEYEMALKKAGIPGKVTKETVESLCWFHSTAERARKECEVLFNMAYGGKNDHTEA